MASIGVDALGVDYRVDLDDAVARIGRDVTVQGNLDPALLFAPEDVRRRAAHAALEGRAARAHVFNLGHGVPMNTDPAVLTDLVRTVHDWRAPEESAR
jgi:uroporphyrinogen decarboxylase